VTGPIGLRTRLYVGAGITAALFVVLSLSGYVVSKRALNRAHAAVSSLTREIERGGRLAYTVARELRLAESYDAAPSPAVLREIWALGDTVRHLQAELAGMSSAADRSEGAAHVLDRLTQVEALYARAHLLSDMGRDSAAAQGRLRASALADHVVTDLNEWLEQRALAQEREAEVMAQRSAGQMRLLLLLLLATGGLLFVIARWTLHGITAPLAALLSKLNRFEQGHTMETAATLAAAVHLPPEIARLSLAIDDWALAQQALRQAERLSGIGRIVSGVAHELNNPLASIMLATEELAETGGVEVHVNVDLIQIHARRAREVVQRLLALARPVAEERAVIIDLGEFLASSVRHVQHRARERNVAIDLQLPDEDVRAPGSPHLLGGAFTNVLVNAVLASPSRSTIRVKLERLPDPEEAMISVTDEGHGIEPSDLPHIFEPFFTTRQPGEGTGLGLALTRRIIEDHGGRIEAHNVRATGARGARFEIILPLGIGATIAESACSEAPAPAVAPADAVAPATAIAPAAAPAEPEAAVASPDADSAMPPLRPGRRALLVEDEDALRMLMARILARDGWIVDQAVNGRDGLSRILAYPPDVARDIIVISDVRMPCMDGLALYRALLRDRPAIAERFLFVTGESVAPTVRDSLDRIGRPVLEKPFEAAELLKLTRQLGELQPN
jgi:signal transduction histidine kinase/ActR/RegA family two-component response regulator